MKFSETGIEESKEMRDFVKQVHIDSDVSNQFTIQIFYPLEKGIEQVGKKDEQNRSSNRS